MIARSPGAKEFVNLLGRIITIEETFNVVSTGTHYTITDSSAFGHFAQNPVGEEPIFDGTNVFVYAGETLIQFVNGTSSLTHNGRITTEPNALFPQATGDTGPFWLYRTAVPEPTSLALLALGVIALISTRNRC